MPYEDEYATITIENDVELGDLIVITTDDNFKWGVTEYEGEDEFDYWNGYGNLIKIEITEGHTYMVTLKSGHTHLVYYVIDPANKTVTLAEL